MAQVTDTRQIKLKNRRVRVGRVNNGIYLGFIKLKEEGEKDGLYSRSKVTGKRVKTELTITKAAAVSLYCLLMKELTMEDLAEFEKDSGQKLMP